MITYNLIIKNIAHTDIDFFSSDYKEDVCDPFIRLAFSIIQDVNLTIAAKYKFKIYHRVFNVFRIRGYMYCRHPYLLLLHRTYHNPKSLTHMLKYVLTITLKEELQIIELIKQCII